MLLITESSEAKTLIVEGKEGEKEYYIEGTFMQSDVKNGNGRIYPKPVLTNQLNEYSTGFIQKHRALGELGHPDSPTVNLERVSHNIVELKYKSDNDIYGKAKLMDTPYGNIAKSFIREGIGLAVSSRGLGSLKNSGGAKVVQNNFKLTAVDIVSEPSAPGAFVDGIMEGKEWILKDGVLSEQQLEEIQDEINHLAGKTDIKTIEENVFGLLDLIKSGNDEIRLL